MNLIKGIVQDAENAVRKVAAVTRELTSEVLGGTPVIELLRHFIPPDVLEAAARGEVWIPQERIASGLSRSLQGGIIVQRLSCSREGVSAVVQRPGWVTVDAEVTAVVERLVVNRQEQALSLLVKDARLSSPNWLGSLGLVILRAVYGDRLLPNALECAAVRPDPTDPARYLCGLSEVPEIRALRDTQVAGFSVLDLLRAIGCRHDEGGVFVKVALADGLHGERR
jgi:hypothetical protein